ncbi:MAG: DUF3352 domain-containing protein [Bacteroides sp.]
MKLKLMIRLAILLSVVLLCTGFGVYSFFRLNAEEHRQDFDLFSLVPQDVVAVLETDHLEELISSIDRMKCSRDGRFLYASDLFVLLKDGLHALVEESAHGLSVQMDKMLLSFHHPDNPSNQVLYCAMGSGDYDLMESFINKFSSAAFPSKYIDYRGEEIRIYPLADGRFLSVYLTRSFLVASFQKHLVEQVIDNHREKQTLSHLKSFVQLPQEGKPNVEARLFVRMTDVYMGADSLQAQARVAGWTAYDLRLEEEAVYCSGVCRDDEYVNSFIHTMKQQQPMQVTSGADIPATAWLYNSYSLTDKQLIWDFLARHAAVTDTLASLRWRAFLQEHAGMQVQCCLFTEPEAEALQSVPHAMVLLSLEQPEQAQRMIHSLYPLKRGERWHVLPDSTLFAGLSGMMPATPLYVGFHKENMLVANSPEAIDCYLKMIKQGEVMEGNEMHESLLTTLSSTCRFLMVADMQSLLQQQSEAYVRLIPHYFLKHARFFGAFTIAIQLTCADDLAYPNLVFLYNE